MAKVIVDGEQLHFRPNPLEVLSGLFPVTVPADRVLSTSYTGNARRAVSGFPRIGRSTPILALFPMRLGQFKNREARTWAAAYGSSPGYVLNIEREPIDKIVLSSSRLPEFEAALAVGFRLDHDSDGAMQPTSPRPPTSYRGNFALAYLVSHILLFIVLIAGAMVSTPVATDGGLEGGPGLIVISVALGHALFSIPFFLLAFFWARKTREILPISLAYGCALVPMYALSTSALFFFAGEYGPGIAAGAWAWLFGALAFLIHVRRLRPDEPLLRT